MKTCCAAYSYRKELTSGAMKLEDFIETCWRLGLDGVELTAYYFESLEEDYLKRLKRSVVDYGLDIRATAVGNDFCIPDPDARAEQVKLVKKWIDVSLYIGAPILRVFAGRVPEGYSEDETFQWAVKAFKECADYASGKGVVLALENHGGITSTSDRVIRIVEAVDSEWFRVNLDVGNYRVDPYREIEETARYAVHVHAKFLDVRPDGSDAKIDHVKVLEILKKTGYKGHLSIEYEGEEDATSAVPRAAKFLQRIVKGG
ncbi:sugar phosphate isomerase/epimerase [Candidatus Bathyarchaeota archaeon]|nr:MAG: sugar phosphate isomerase/epimerase [Candidatus Bathyarchaeota archaeon]